MDIHTNSLIVTDLVGRRSFTWFPSIQDLPDWAKASPFRIPLSWILNQVGMQVVHGAAVSRGGHAVLLAGEGGAGKSTTSLACATAGMKYLGDDYCAVEPAHNKVHLLYRSAKVLASTVAMLPDFRALLVNADRLDREKGVLFFKPDDPVLARTAELRCILLPKLGRGPVALLPASPSDALAALLPSTIGGLMGGTRATPGLLLNLVRRIPAFHLHLSNDLPAVARTVDLALEKAA